MTQPKKNFKRHNLDFDPNGPISEDAGLFGLNVPLNEAAIGIIEVAWEATTSYGKGTAQGPASIVRASHQLDLYHPTIHRPYEYGYAYLPFPDTLNALHLATKKWVDAENHKEVNKAGLELNNYVQKTAASLLKMHKIPAVLGGDHSSPLGLMHALAQQFAEGYGILHIDAHADLRCAYQGFKFSHASIMYNALQIPEVTKIVQVGIRDWCEEEANLIKQSPERIHTYYDEELQSEMMHGTPWAQIVSKIISDLPDNVYISFDIDGLDPNLCPRTGTPVPGGLSYAQALFLLKQLSESNRRIVGFDLCEVAGSAAHVTSPQQEWDANIGARVLYQLCALTLKNRLIDEAH